MPFPQNSLPPRLGVAALAAIVFGAVIGGGIFNIAQNMGQFAAPAPALLAWAITGAGFLLLVLTFRILARKRPDLHAGIYQYAQAGFGPYAGFNIAWGYWLCAAMGNVGFVVMLCQSLGALWPPLLNGGWQMLAVGSAIIWSMCALVARGVRNPAAINTALSAVKFASLALIILLLALAFRLDIFSADIWGANAHLGAVPHQLKETMLITLWCFIGIEGAVVMSARARRPADVGRASVIGFLAALLLYVIITALCYGVMARASLASLDNPSLAYLLRAAVGPWAYWLVIASVIVALTGGLVAWTLVCAQTPYTAARAHILPPVFARENSRGIPTFSLIVSSVAMQIFLVVVVTAQEVYLAAIELTGMLVLPAYLFCGLYLLKGAWGRRHPFRVYSRKMLWYMRSLGAACSLFCCWLIYAGGLLLMLLTSIVYALGIFFFVSARRHCPPSHSINSSPSKSLSLTSTQPLSSHSLPLFTPPERLALILIILAASLSLALLFTGLASL